MAKDIILKARVDEELADAVDAWAEEHGADRSETIRVALRRLIGQQALQGKMDEIARRFDAYEDAGLFEPPEDDSWKVGGFR